MRFHAYGIGLAKTGTTTLSSAFALSKSAHEWANFRLNPLGRARLRGQVNDDEFWRRAGGRLTRPVVSMDVSTTHHLYADALADRFPDAHFVWTTRGVREWSNSLLDMYVREDCRAEACGVQPLTWSMRFPARPYTGAESFADTPDTVMLTTLIRSWSEHMHRINHVLPPNRIMTVPVKELSGRLSDISSFVGADPARLVQIHRPANARPSGLAFDRWQHSSDWHPAYDLYAADLMRQWFPSEHEDIMNLRASRSAQVDAEAAWTDYVTRTRSAMSFPDQDAQIRHRTKLQRLMTTAQLCTDAVAAHRSRIPETV